MTSMAKLLSRIKRIQGQLASVSLSIENEKDVSNVLQTVAASRGAINGLIAEIIENHVLTDVVPKDGNWGTEHESAAKKLNQIVATYLK